MGGLEDVFGEVLTTGLMGGKREKFGCFIFFLIAGLIFGGYVYYQNNLPVEQIKGVVLFKMSDNRLLVKTKSGEETFDVTQELYDNKKVNDSIHLIQK